MEFLPDDGHAVTRESGETMTRRPRRNHTPAFKAKVKEADHCEPTLTIKTASERIGHWIKTLRSLVRFNGP